MSHDDDTDEILASRVREGDHVAYDTLCRRRYQYVRSIGLKMGVADNDVDDLTQAAWTRIWVARQSYEPPRPFLPWARRIMINIVRSHWRRVQSRREDLIDDIEAVKIANPMIDHRCLAERVASEEIVRNALANLNIVYREVKVMADFLHMPIDDIAATLGKSRSQVSRLLSRARPQFNQMISKQLMEYTGDGSSER